VLGSFSLSCSWWCQVRERFALVSLTQDLIALKENESLMSFLTFQDFMHSFKY
jgi:hypothetical protein